MNKENMAAEQEVETTEEVLTEQEIEDLSTTDEGWTGIY